MKKVFFDILVYIRYRLLNIIWSVSKKKKATINDWGEIKYITTSKYLTWRFKRGKIKFGGAMCLVHKPKQKLMIFFNKEEYLDPLFRYTLLHEYIEGRYLLGVDKNFQEKLELKYRPILEDIKNNFPDLLEALEKSWIKNCASKEHILALIFEFGLEREELPYDKIQDIIDEIIKKRL